MVLFPYAYVHHAGLGMREVSRPLGNGEHSGIWQLYEAGLLGSSMGQSAYVSDPLMNHHIPASTTVA